MEASSEAEPVEPNAVGTLESAPLDRQTIGAALDRMGLRRPGERLECRPLDGGVSSEIWLVELPGRRLCLKRALPRLRVAQLWEAPVVRNHYEAAWFRVAGGICPDAVPRSARRGRAARDVRDGLSRPRRLSGLEIPAARRPCRSGCRGSVGERLARIHAATAGDAAIARDFATDDSFYALRIEPYLIASIRPASRSRRAARPARAGPPPSTRLALVHGDVSPKNILIGPRGPVFLDAECAWYGDPAFDLAFCLNHLLLKCLWNRRAVAGFLACFDRLAETYLGGVAWEPPRGARSARCAPAAGAAAGADRRQVAGRIRHARNRQGPGAAGRAGAAD